MNLTRLERHQHPKPPHQELRQKSVFDSGSRSIGQVGNLYVDEDSNLQVPGRVHERVLGLRHEALSRSRRSHSRGVSGAVTLTVDQQSVESAPTLANPKGAPGEELQRAAHEHYGLGAVL
jgi:hypothetical protein